MKIFYRCLTLMTCVLMSCVNITGPQNIDQVISVDVFDDLIQYQYLYKTSKVNSGLTVETFEIKYRVKALMITGYIHKPVGEQTVYPGLIYYRGENGDIDNIDRNELEKQRDLAGEGFVVMSSQLRGNIFSQGHDRSDGADVKDILQLVKIAKCLSFVDSQNLDIYNATKDDMSTAQLDLIKEVVYSNSSSCNQASRADLYNHTVEIEVFNDLISYQYLYSSGNMMNGVIIETYEIKYRVNGLMITGYINKPSTDSKIYPAILYCRGGNRDFGTFGRGQLDIQRQLASQGFVVLSSQLRGNIFSQGKDEMGGADLNDIMQLIEIAKKLPFVNGSKIGIHGVSRGGSNAYQISRMSDDISSISVIGAPVDIRDSHPYRPEKYTMVNLPLIGDTIQFKEEYDKRSAIFWVDELNEPLLILHGKADWRSKIENVKRIIPELEKYNKEFDYHFIEEGSHALGSHTDLRDSLVANWHKKYLY